MTVLDFVFVMKLHRHFCNENAQTPKKLYNMCTIERVHFDSGGKMTGRKKIQC